MDKIPAVVCVVCGERIYFCKAVGRDFVGDRVRADDFVPIGDHEQPRIGQAMICPRCRHTFCYGTEKGIVLKLEGGAWWPHPPIQRS